jgi:hypothetical protein
MIFLIMCESWCFASPGLGALSPEAAKEHAFSGEILFHSDKTASVTIKLSETSALRRGQLRLLIPYESGKIKSVWNVEPGRPLLVQFTIPLELLEKVTLFFAISRKSEPELEYYTFSYTVDITNKQLFQGKSESP